MISNHSLIKILRNENKRNIGMFILSLFVFLFCIILPFVISIINSFQEKRYEYNIVMHIYNNFKNYFGFGILHMFLTTCFAIGIANYVFGYLHKKEEVDFYHSFPITRKELYISKFLLGISIYMVPWTIIMIVGFIFSFMKCLIGTNVHYILLNTYIIDIIYFLLCYSISIFAMMLTGKKIIGFIGSIILLFFGLIIGSILYGYYMIFFKTYENLTFNDNFLYEKIYNISPIFVFGNIAYKFSSIFDDTKSIFTNYEKTIFISIIVIIVLFFINLGLYKKRRLETATNSMSFDLGKNIIRDILVICGSLCGVFIPMLVSEFGKTKNPKIVIFCIIWIVVFGIITHCIMEIIYNQDFKMLFNNKKSMIISILFAILIFCIFKFDLFGYDKYVPKNEEIKEVMLKIDGENVFNLYYYDEEKEEYKYVHNQNKDMFDNSHITNENTIKSIKQLIEISHKNEDENSRSNIIRVVWRLRNGKIVNRKYNVDLRENKNIFNNIFCDINYKKSYIPLLREEEYYDEIKIIGVQKTFDIKKQDEKIIIEALKKDIEKFTFLEKVDKYPIALLKCELKNGKDENTKNIAGKDYSMIYQEYPIYESFNNVLRFLKERDIDIYSHLENIDNLYIKLLYDNEEKEIEDKNLKSIIVNNMIESYVTSKNSNFGPETTKGFPSRVYIENNTYNSFYTLIENDETKIFCK